MNVELIFAIVFAVLTIVGALVSYYFYIKKKLSEAVADEIDKVEDSDKVAEEKRALVVDQLRALIPAIFRPFFSTEMLEAMVQAVFDKIEDYAKKQLKKKGGK